MESSYSVHPAHLSAVVVSEALRAHARMQIFADTGVALRWIKGEIE